MSGGTYEDLLRDLFARRRFGIDLGLERVAQVAAKLGPLPPIIRVAGTNGKGSVCAFVSAALREAGVRLGRFTSPHLCRFSERFNVNGSEVEPADLVRAAARVDEVADAELTFFEYATVLALALFREAVVDVAVLEVGLGGRLDATRAVTAEVAAVVSVGLDHQEILGSTLPAIAREKAGAFESGKAAVIGGFGAPAITEALEATARQVGAEPIAVVEKPFLGQLRARGTHQRENAAVALAVLEAAVGADLIPRSRTAWEAAIADTVIPGRFEQVAEKPAVIIDVAHNAASAVALGSEIQKLPWRPLVAVIGASQDKDAGAILEPVVKVVDEVFVTRSAHSRAAEPSALLAHVPFARVEDSLSLAMEQAARLAGDEGAVIACGSVFVAGEARAWATGEALDSVPATEP